MTAPLPSFAATEEQLSARAAEELEVHLADLESRVRKASLELLSPTIARTKELEESVKKLREEVWRGSKISDELNLVAANVRNQGGMFDSFRELLGKWEREQVARNADSAEALSLLRASLDGHRHNLELGNASIASIKRAVDRSATELQAVQEQQDGLRKHCNHNIENLRQLMNTFTNEFSTKMAMLETKQHSLDDNVWNNASGLVTLGREMKNIEETVSELCSQVQQLNVNKASVTGLQGMREQVGQQIDEGSQNMKALNVKLNGMTKDVKDNFKVATATVATQSASMLSEVRRSFQEELAKCELLTAEVKAFMEETQRYADELKQRVTAVEIRSDDAAQKVAVSMESRSKRFGSVDHGGEFAVESKAMQADVLSTKDSVQAIARSVDHMGHILWMVVQSERAAAAMTTQDDSDRAKVALVGYRESSKESPGSTRPSSNESNWSPPTAPSGKKGSTPRKKTAKPSERPEQGDEGAVITVDPRCLSCSGQARTVLAGFKMACLQYAPGPVQFARKNWDRAELMDLREQLLEEACECLKASTKRTDPFDAKEQEAKPLNLGAALAPLSPASPAGTGDRGMPGGRSGEQAASRKGGAANTAVLPVLPSPRVIVPP